MDLFDKIKKKTSDAFDYTRDKAYNISEEIRIRGLINESKEKVSNFYREIGKIVFENVKNERDLSKDEVKSQCEAIMREEENIAKLETEILALKAIKKCVKCGAELDNNAEFCSKCGEKQPKMEVPEKEEEKENNEVAEEANEANSLENNDNNENNENHEGDDNQQ